MIGLTTDQGADVKLQELPAFNPNSMYPHWDESPGVESDETTLESMHGKCCQQITLARATRIVGEEYILHTIQKHCFEILPSFEPWYFEAKEIGRRSYESKHFSTPHDHPSASDGWTSTRAAR